MARTELTGRQVKDRSLDLTADVTGVLPVANGGTGSDTLALNNVLLGNGTGALQAIAPGTSGNVLTSDGTTWVSSAPAGGGAGDVTTNTATSVDGELVLFDGTTGKALRRATGTGWVYVTAGVLSTEATVPQSAVTDLETDLAAKQDTAEKGVAGGYASLGLDGLVPVEQLPEIGAVDSVNGYTGVITLTPTDLGLGSVDNTSDLDKPISTATQSALDGKSDTGHGHTQSDILDLTTDLAAKEDAANKGIAGGYASLDGGGKVPVSQLPASLMQYQGVWDASTNTPTLVDGGGDIGDVYRVSVAGDQNLGSGSISFAVGDYAILNAATVWEKSDTTDAVASVNGYTGIVSLTQSDVGLPNVDDTADLDKPVSTATQSALDDKEDTANKGVANGYAALDSTGKVPGTQLPITQADWATLDGKPAVIAAGATEADARDAIDAEYTGNKGQPGGYAELDITGVVPVPQIPPGLIIDGIEVGSETFQLLSGTTPIGDPISITLGNVDGGTPGSVTSATVDGGQL